MFMLKSIVSHSLSQKLLIVNITGFNCFYKASSHSANAQK